ncbi:MAG: VCBS repeat-containing protein [bacterium]|nr:VCBS repeat-containing protein [bacterium]
MDLNGDGHIDILSGSYSRQGTAMAGLLQVLHGKGKGEFGLATPLAGSDGEPLIIQPRNGESDDSVLDQICTRPFAADLDGDGNLDLVVGNFRGTFAVFAGESGGKFAAQNTWLERDGEPLSVPAHGDPCLVDWDRDGDLDLFSGSGEGGAFWFENVGTKTAPAWSERRTLVASTKSPNAFSSDARFGDDHITGPQRSTRIWIDDVDGDGLLDVLLGDSFIVLAPAKGLELAEAEKRYAEWCKQYDEAAKAEDEKALDRLWKEREKLVAMQSTGSVWLLRQLPPAGATETRGQER